MPDSLTIIVPIFNEEDNLSRLADALLKLIDSIENKTSILLVNDGSTDKSLNIIEDICARHKQINFINLRGNQGLSAALFRGVNNCNTELVGYMDADLQTSPLDFIELLKKIEYHDMVTGIRTNRKDSFIKQISSKIANALRQVVTNDGIEDTTCPLKLIRLKYAKHLPNFKGMHRFIPALVKLYGGSVAQVPIIHHPRVAGESKFGIINRIGEGVLGCYKYLKIKQELNKSQK